MPKFFEKVTGDTVLLNEENSNHILNSLRMNIGDELILCDDGTEYYCQLSEISSSNAACRVLKSSKNQSEPSTEITLFQCMPKGDKLELVIQKSVELGVTKIVPVLSERCVSRPDEKKFAKKLERYKKIAKSACEQSGRGRIVEVEPMISLKNAAEQIKDFNSAFLFYEGGGESLLQTVKRQKTVSIFIGPEGGFSESEVNLLCDKGAIKSTLGKRILRTETAPIAAITAVMLLTGNLE